MTPTCIHKGDQQPLPRCNNTSLSTETLHQKKKIKKLKKPFGQEVKHFQSEKVQMPSFKASKKNYFNRFSFHFIFLICLGR